MRNNNGEKLLYTAEKLISREGDKGTSLQKIACKFGLPKSLIFHYSRNKEELLLGILNRFYDGMIKNLEEIVKNRELKPEEKLKKAFDSHLTLLVK
jgi:AcrR family transcriptional regulator